MERIAQDDYFMGIADLVSQRSTCIRRRVGCVILNNFHHIVATGHNGVPRGINHCIDYLCPGANYKTGDGLDKCWAVHAEANALMQCTNVMQIGTIYVTAKPCVHCMKMLMNTSCHELVYDQEYKTDLQGLEPKFKMRQHMAMAFVR